MILFMATSFRRASSNPFRLRYLTLDLVSGFDEKTTIELSHFRLFAAGASRLRFWRSTLEVDFGLLLLESNPVYADIVA
jgi:hypothetical protein